MLLKLTSTNTSPQYAKVKRWADNIVLEGEEITNFALIEIEEYIYVPPVEIVQA
jgi:hypothetical protein